MKTFPIGGVHPSENKLSGAKPIEVLPLPDVVTIPLAQHIGAPAVAKVAKGDRVLTGQLIAEAGSFMSANIHSPISGTVTAVDMVVNGQGLRQMMITIKREGDDWAEGIDRSEALVKVCSFSAQEIIAKITVCKQVADVHTNIWAQVLCERFLATQNIEQHLAGLQKIYRHKCNLMLEGMEQHFSRKITWTKPEGGLFIWATLPQGSDMMGFCKRAVSEYKIAVVPGTAFSIRENDPSDSFRLNFSTPTDEQIVRGIEILGNMTRELLDK